MHTAKGVLTAQHGRSIFSLFLLYFFLCYYSGYLPWICYNSSFRVINAFFGNCDSNIATIVKIRVAKGHYSHPCRYGIINERTSDANFFVILWPDLMSRSKFRSQPQHVVIMGFYSGIAPADLRHWVTGF